MEFTYKCTGYKILMKVVSNCPLTCNSSYKTSGITDKTTKVAIYWDVWSHIYDVVRGVIRACQMGRTLRGSEQHRSNVSSDTD